MKTKSIIYIVSFFTILIISCDKKLTNKQDASKFFGFWFDTVQGIPFSSKLIIKEILLLNT